MPALSKTTAPNVADFGKALDQGGDLAGYTAEFVTIRESHSLADVLKGLPGDSCQCPHWGYMLTGELTVSYGDREETYRAGDAYYMPPGHVPTAAAGSEFIQFSPTEELGVTLAAIQANAAALQSG
jgi:ethanolamine utilization protein EutQ (cupin superfamily)